MYSSVSKISPSGGKVNKAKYTTGTRLTSTTSVGSFPFLLRPPRSQVKDITVQVASSGTRSLNSAVASQQISVFSCGYDCERDENDDRAVSRDLPLSANDASSGHRSRAPGSTTKVASSQLARRQIKTE